MGGKADATRESGMIKLMTRSTGSTSNAYNCGDKEHPVSHCRKTKKDKYNDDKSTSSTSSRVSVEKLAKDVKKVSRLFTTVNTQL